VVGFFDRYEGLDEAVRADRDGPLVERLFDRTGSVDFHDAGGTTLGPEDISLQELLANLLERLAEVGFGQVFRYRFDIDLGGLEVVRIIVPRCEDAENTPVRMGPRLFERVTGASLCRAVEPRTAA
jgi:ribosomal protein S12 methylthiotransferase accessory factor YcaO